MALPLINPNPNPNPFHRISFPNNPMLSLSSLSPPPSPTLTFRRPLTVASACTTTTVGPYPPSTLYDILGISVSATSDEIKAAYRRLARSCHPDVIKGGGERKSGDEEFIKVHAAYSTLSDPDKRAVYDRNLTPRKARILTARDFPGISSLSPNASSFCKYPRRNWETDQCW